MGSYLDLDDATAGHPKAEHELHLMREHIKGLESELETLRAENERLKTELLCLTHDRDMLKLCADHNEDEVKKMHAELKESAFTLCALRAEIDEYQAEREAMMKQEPVGYAVEIYWRSMIDPGDCGDGLEIWSVEDFIKRAEHDISDENVFPVYAKPHPLPAQQIPEGYAIEILRKVFDLYESGVDCYDSEDHYSAAYLGKCIRLDDDLFKSCVDLLSASQPKGDEWIEIPKFLRRGDD